jgi:RNA polymerase sigma factor (sigma-70 family)
MLTPVATERASDAELWQLVRQGSAPAFEAVVRRHQSLVCAVAYSSCGDLTLSEDIAQETFWAAWRERGTLEGAGRLRSWLCGIARNLGNNARRRASRAAAATPLEAVAEPSAPTPDPAEEAASREEESLVWQTLGQIPETYREALVLFYREQQSVAEVAAALELSEDAVKQRLSRGRGMLRERVAELVGETLRRSRPGRAFTIAVMTGLTALSAGTKTALAGAGTAGTGAALAGGAGPALKAAVGTGLAGGALGGILGSLGGLAGGWLGTWVPAQLAPTRRERAYLLRAGRRMLVVSVLFMAVLTAGAVTLPERYPIPYYLTFWFAWFVTYGAYVAVESLRYAREAKRIRAETTSTAELNDSPLRTRLNAVAARYHGRVFRSRATLFGLPLIDINVRDPAPPGGAGRAELPRAERGVARGWIAIGDDAYGVVLAIGSRARGFVAIGGRLALGALSFGGIAVGLLAVGGLSLGVLGIGGLGVGVYAIGGGAVGWQACGGMGVAWDVACGGGAAAWHAAYGGAAVAHDYAFGGGVWAHHANDEAAKAILLNHPLVRGMGWYNAHTGWCTTVIVLLSLLVPGAMLPLMYRRESRQEGRGP